MPASASLFGPQQFFNEISGQSSGHLAALFRTVRFILRLSLVVYLYSCSLGLL